MRKPNYPVILFIAILIVVGVASYFAKSAWPAGDPVNFWNDWDVPSFLLNIFLSGIVLVGITLPQYRQEKYRERVDDFKKVCDELATDSNRYSIAALNHYRKKYFIDPDMRKEGDGLDEEYKKAGFIYDDGYLLYKDDWMPLNNGKELKLFHLDGEEIIEGNKNTAAGKDNILVKVKGIYQSNGPNRNKKLPDMDEGYAENVKFFTNRNIYNGWMYGLKTLTFAGGKPCFEILEGHYYDYYNTCEYLSYESAYAERILGKKKNQWSEEHMPERFLKDVFSPENRFAGIGISTITLLTGVNAKNSDDNGETYFLLHKRSSNVAQGMNNYHVIPAGGYEPVKPISLIDPKKKDNENEEQKIGEIKPMLDSVLREFGEELLGYEEYFDLSNSDLLGVLKGVVKPVFLGAGFEPLNTMLDVLAAIVINVNTMPEVNGMPLFPKLENGRLQNVPATTDSELEEVLNMNSNFEGEITLIPFEGSRLKQYEMDMRSTAGMRQFMKILQYKNVQKLLGIHSNA